MVWYGMVRQCQRIWPTSMVWYRMGVSSGTVASMLQSAQLPGDIGDNVPANGSQIMDVWMPVPSDGPIPFGVGSPSCPCQGEFSNEEVRQVKVAVKCSIHPPSPER